MPENGSGIRNVKSSDFRYKDWQEKNKNRREKWKEKKKGVGYDMPFCADIFYNASASQLFFGRGTFCKG